MRMLERLKRPGYWIVLLAIVTVYSYHAFQKNEKKVEKKSLLSIYRAYGDTVLSELKNRDLLALQSQFGAEGGQKIDLEDIALFIDTLHLDRLHSPRWRDVNRSGNNLVFQGSLRLENNDSYPIDMIMIHRGGKILLESMKVGSRILKMDRDSFPLNLPIESSADAKLLEGNGSRTIETNGSF
ncbi:hypothetical protein [Nitratifractor sp.]|uniref:hypothetical protein n=1 Tax=Nitratifractor sp. TaxID=2268144 RepID=UPI0025F7F721|nr:hypothetical protein [Nitratifractor sp.]